MKRLFDDDLLFRFRKRWCDIRSFPSRNDGTIFWPLRITRPSPLRRSGSMGINTSVTLTSSSDTPPPSTMRRASPRLWRGCSTRAGPQPGDPERPVLLKASGRHIVQAATAAKERFGCFGRFVGLLLTMHQLCNLKRQYLLALLISWSFKAPKAYLVHRQQVKAPGIFLR